MCRDHVHFINYCVFIMQQAAYDQEVTEDVRSKAQLYGVECTTGYIDLLEHVLLVCVCVCVLVGF